MQSVRYIDRRELDLCRLYKLKSTGWKCGGSTMCIATRASMSDRQAVTMRAWITGAP